ncbi:hypothetical protein VTO73DRAFT_12637 [Trametes versicolor]
MSFAHEKVSSPGPSLSGASADDGSEGTQSRAKPSLISQIDEDVFALIVAMLLQSGRIYGFQAILHLSLSCRRLRILSLPALFSRCSITNAGIVHTGGVPPLAIRPYVQHLTYYLAFYAAQFHASYAPQAGVDFAMPLRYLPFVRSVTFTGASSGVPWEALKLCLSFPQVRSITFTGSATFVCMPSFPKDAAASTSRLEELFYPTPLIPSVPFLIDSTTTYHGMCTLVTACLSTLVLGMNSTARSLVLPATTAPLREMAKVDWPALGSLTLKGSFPDDADHLTTESLPSMLRRMPALEHLVITAALFHYTTTRCCVLGRNLAPPDAGLNSLERLTIAYPDPNDVVFSIPLPRLTRLDLRDWPRHYDIVAHEYYSRAWRSPILSATEALFILRRLRAPGLAVLELVYFADEADDDLLALIAHAFPKLQYLQLHRYRRSSEEVVDHQYIARILSALKSVLVLRLNLDFPGDPGEYKPNVGNGSALKQWRRQLSTFGSEILDTLEPCPLLRCIALLYHGEPPSMWVWFYRSPQGARRAYDKAPNRRDTFAPQYPFAEKRGTGFMRVSRLS